MSESLFNKVTDLQACNFVKKRLRHKCFPVKFAKFSRTAILKNVCERLLLKSEYVMQNSFFDKKIPTIVALNIQIYSGSNKFGRNIQIPRNKYFSRILVSSYRCSHWQFFFKIGVLKILQYLQENTCVGVSF